MQMASHTFFSFYVTLHLWFLNCPNLWHDSVWLQSVRADLFRLNDSFLWLLVHWYWAILLTSFLSSSNWVLNSIPVSSLQVWSQFFHGIWYTSSPCTFCHVCLSCSFCFHLYGQLLSVTMIDSQKPEVHYRCDLFLLFYVTHMTASSN